MTAPENSQCHIQKLTTKYFPHLGNGMRENAFTYEYREQSQP